MKKTLMSAVLALLLSACTEDLVVQTAALQGTVYEVGGQSADLAGVGVALVETGHYALTDENGGFRMNGLPPGIYTLEFNAGQFGNLGDGERENDGDGDVQVEVKRDGGDVEIRVAIESDGRVKDFEMDDFEDRHAMAALHRPEGSERRIEGGVKLSSTRHGERFAVTVWGLEPGTVVDICIGDDNVGSAETNADGVTKFVRETGNLPLGSLEALFGKRVTVKLGDEVLLLGEVPDLPAEREREDDGAGEGDKKDGGDDDGAGEGDEKDGGDDDGAGEGDEKDGDGDDEAGEGDEKDGDDEAGEGDEKDGGDDDEAGEGDEKDGGDAGGEDTGTGEGDAR